MRFSTERRILPSAIHLPGVGGSQLTASKLEVNLKGEEVGREEGLTAVSKLSPKEVLLTILGRSRVSPEGYLKNAP